MISNKRIVITGATSGIGLETLKLIVKKGKDNKILAVGRNLVNLQGLDPNVVIPFKADISTKEGVDSVFDAALEKLGGIDLYFSNAGFCYYEKLDYVSWEKTEKIYSTNVFGSIYAFEKYMQYVGTTKPGHFAMTISAMGHMALPGYTLYTSTKFALEGFQDAIQYELPKNFKLTRVYPVGTKTQFFERGNSAKFEKPFPFQDVKTVAKFIYWGLDNQVASIYPYPAYLVCKYMFPIFPPAKKAFMAVENGKFKRFKRRQEKENKKR